ncbi:MAG: OstA-like protein [Bacteroidia bacterium]
MQYKSYLFILILLLNQKLSAQTKNRVEIIFARNFEGIKTQAGQVNKLIGDVQLREGKTLMWCDSAYIFEAENITEAYNRVKIIHNDSVTITGDYLRYDANEKTAVISGNVVLKDNSITLTTDNLEYETASGVAYYNTGGIIVSEKNKLTSQLGYYYTRQKEFFFRKKVVLTNPEYKMEGDTLLYNTQTKTAFFFGPTTINGTSEKIYCENGWYNTITDVSQFSKNAVLHSEGLKLKADSLHYNKKQKLGKAYRNIELFDSAQQVYVYGNFGQTNGVTGITFVTQKANALKLMSNNKDSLIIYADTIMLLEELPKQKQQIKAFKKVKLIKSDIQAICDSLVYNKTDSQMYFFKKPVLWSGLNQITSDTMVFYLANNKLDSFALLSNSFIAQKEKGIHFNQIRGRNMAGLFDSSNIKYINVYGNGQSIYYAKEDSVNYTGVNMIDCSEMVFYFDKNRIEKAVFITNADANLYPLDEKKPDELRLKGFKWLENERPKRTYYY